MKPAWTDRERRDVDWRIKRIRRLADGFPSFDAEGLAYRYGRDLARMARELQRRSHSCRNCNRYHRGAASVESHGPDGHSEFRHEHCSDCGRILSVRHSDASFVIKPIPKGA